MDPVFSQQVQAGLEWVLVWIGFGTCVGLSAKALMPGRDPGGAVATLLMGITGVVIGCGVYSLIYKRQVEPITPAGLCCGTLGAFTLLLFYRLLAGFLLEEAGSTERRPRPVRGELPRRPRRRRYSHYLEE